MPENCFYILSDIIGRADTLELACVRCERRGRLSVARSGGRIRTGYAAAYDHARRSAIACGVEAMVNLALRDTGWHQCEAWLRWDFEHGEQNSSRG